MRVWEGHWYIYWLPHEGPELYAANHHHYELNSEGAKGLYGPHLLYDFTRENPEDNPKTIPRRLDTVHIDEIHSAFLKAYKKQRGIDLVWERQSYP